MGDPLGPLVSGVPLLPAQTPNQEGVLDEAQRQPKDSKPDEVLTPSSKAPEVREVLHSACPMCRCTSKSNAA